MKLTPPSALRQEKERDFLLLVHSLGLEMRLFLIHFLFIEFPTRLHSRLYRGWVMKNTTAVYVRFYRNPFDTSTEIIPGRPDSIKSLLK